MSNSKVTTAASSFAQQYAKNGSGIVSVGTIGDGIKVVVKKLAAAAGLPTLFEGFEVVVYQSGGGVLEDKLILRDDDGTVSGVEG
jgi:hypothetical protein